jgi:hypothetical protein
MALAFLREHPDFNVAQLVGLHWTDLQFTRVVGAIEVLFGLLVYGSDPVLRPAVSALWPFATPRCGIPRIVFGTDVR